MLSELLCDQCIVSGFISTGPNLRHDYSSVTKCVSIWHLANIAPVSPAPRVGSYHHLACLRTGVSLGNRPIVWINNAENTACALEGPCVDRVPRGVPLWSGMGKPGDLRDRPADKISVPLGQGLEVGRSVGRTIGLLYCSLLLDCFLMPFYCVSLLGICLIPSISS